MTKYKLKVQDGPESESRLQFINRLEAFLRELRSSQIIGEYKLSFGGYDNVIFASESDEP